MYGDYTITSLETITAFGIDGEYLFTLDELQSATIANTQEKVDITGANGRKLNSLKRSKAVTVSGTNGLISTGLLAIQTGSETQTKDSTAIRWTDYLTIESNAAATTYKAVGATGSEIENLYIKNADGTLGAKLTQGSAVAEGTFTYDPTTKALAFNSGDYADGTEIVVYYDRNIAGAVVENISDVYSQKCQLYIDAFGEDKCNNIYRIQFYIPRADFSGNFDITLGDNQAVHAFEAESLAGAKCGSNVAANAGTLWTYTIFGANAADA